MNKDIHPQAGFSLIELLLAMVLLLILIGPLLSFMRVGQISRATAIRITDVEQNVRAAMTSVGRDISNAGYNFAPQVSLGVSPIFSTLLGSGNLLSPIIPGNNLNLVRSVNSTGATVTNSTDQITLVYLDQNFNNGLPVSGNLTPSGANFSATASFTGLFIGDFVLVSLANNFAIGCVTNVTGGNNVIFASSDPYGINQPGTGPLSVLGRAPQQPGAVSLYKIFFVSYFVDQDGNLIRRELLPAPHTAQGGNNSITPVLITPNPNTYNCNGSCYYDNVIATGIEDLQFTYFLADPRSTGVTGPLDDPGFYGRTTNLGTAPQYRLLDIRQVNVSIKGRAAERDNNLHDPYNRNQHYLYRFSLEGTFNTRNFFGSNFRL
ncbi:MAG: prepilin-type N-terminal cleavage/methylation domain-containing protein [Acidobacteriota bacterium]